MNSPWRTMTTPLQITHTSALCSLLGHKVDDTKITKDTRTPCARCGIAILDQNQSVSRVAHTLSCFFGGHQYVPIARRSRHNEYVCKRCGHPLLLEVARDPYDSNEKFKKRVNYACGLLGHRVHVVETGAKATEYACRCGHSFLKKETALELIRHPLSCMLLGHYLIVNQLRGEWMEYVCFRCGHPFCFSWTTRGLKSDLEQRQHV